MKGFLILSVISCVYAQGQDLCGSASPEATTGFTFADDPSDCTGYLWCNYRGTNLVSVHQGRCSTGNFNGATSTCDVGFTCTDRCQFIDAASTIRVAVPGDRNCRSFQTCTGSTIGSTVSNCTATSVFNRNFGVCTVPSIAPCTVSESALCDVGNDGFFNDESGCAKYIFCKNGVGTRESCPGNLHFNPNGNFCDSPGNLNPPCTDTAAVNHGQIPFGPEIPRPPHVDSRIKMKYQRMSML